MHWLCINTVNGFNETLLLENQQHQQFNWICTCVLLSVNTARVNRKTVETVQRSAVQAPQGFDLSSSLSAFLAFQSQGF